MRNYWLRLAATFAAAVLGALVAAQDFPALKGGSARLGRNSQPALSGPGIAGLGWWRPNALDAVAGGAIVDNLDAAFVSSTGPVWSAVTQVGEWAESPYRPDDNQNPATFPAYRYGFATPSASFLQPEVPLVPSQHQTWTFRFDAANLGAAARNLALYVWLPIGPTYPGLGPAKFPIRYYVYEVFYGAGQRELQIVDTYNAGFGWVRLGSGGAATSRLYEFDGATPIRIVLHNTVVRDAFGNLTENVTTTTRTANPIMYADAAMALPQNGAYRASPVVSDVDTTAANDLRALGAFNEFSVAIRNGESSTITKGVVTSYRHDGSPGVDAPNNTVWRYSPLEDDTSLTVYQDDQGAGFTSGPGWVAQVAPPVFRGVGFHDIDVTDQVILQQQCEWAPNLADGSFEIWAWVPGSVSGMTLSRDVTYEIDEGGTVTTVTVDQDAARGWVRLGTRRFNHDSTNNLSVRVINLGPATELGRKVYADQLRFLGATDTAIDSTPLQIVARVNVPSLGGLVDRSVVVVPAENGKIYCLDAVGNADGTTNVYWTYPSTPDPDNSSWTDPNWVVGEDGPNGIAEMPTGFNLSSALVERIGGEDYLYISGNNGRVYCIEMAGRGDMNLSNRKPGTTRRRWSYPNDYPAQAAPANLGASFGSVAFGNSPAGPTIFVPSSQGRLFALDAVGNVGTKTTTVRWAYPPVNQPTLGACEMTPTVEFDRVYVGFRKPSDESPASFVALNWATGAVDWTFNGTTLWSTSLTTFIPADDFVSGPVSIPATELAGQADTIVVANDNRWITALNAQTGAVLWTTDELLSPVLGNLTYTPMTVYDTSAALTTQPVVLVPTSDGRFAGLFAQATTTNIFGAGFRLAWGWQAGASERPMETSMASGRNWLYGADPNGVFYAFHNGTSVIPGAGGSPGQQIVPPNDPATIPFRTAKIKFVTKAAYERLRLPENDTNQLTYAQATSAAFAMNRTAFEWGETIYAMVYDIPAEVDSNPDPNERTQVEFRFSAEGIAVRNLTVRSKQFADVGANNPPTEPVSGERLDGFAVLAYTLQGSGSNALPPGAGVVAFDIRAQFQQNGALQTVAVNPATSRRNFSIANPIGIGVQFDNAGLPLANYSLGYTTDAANPEAAINGSGDISTTTKLENRLLANVGLAQHNSTKTKVWALYDRSLMTLLRGPGRGLDLLRVQRDDLNWQGGPGAVYKPINALNYPGFEDLPNTFPNTSLDYPDIKRENALIVKDKFGATENPLSSAIQLAAPTNVDVNSPLTRVLVATPMDFDLNVPRFQPPNTTNVPDSSGGAVSSGYYGSLIVFIDGTGNGSFDRRGRREAYRSMWLGGSVAVDEKVLVNKTELDLGSLPQGAGFDPTGPWTGSSFTPWAGPYQTMFQSFQVLNEGNVNMLNMRIAKSYDYGARPIPWGLFAPANNDRSWIDTQYNLWSDIDETFALNHLGGANSVLLQKPRVGDRSATELLTNPIRRDNFNLGVTQSSLLASPTPAPPRLAVTAPFGTPVGSYLTDIYVIEDVDGNESLRYDNAQNQNPREIATDPTIRVKFTVRETRLTNGHTRLASPMIHGQVAGNEPFLHQNAQPSATRDLNGQMLVAYVSSNILGFNQPFPTDANTSDTWRIYLATIDGLSQTGGGVVGSNPLRDLNSWTPQAGRLFRQAVGPFPTQPATDPLLFGPTSIASTAKFGGPAFAAIGGINPFNTSQQTNPYMAYVGESQLQTPTGREFASKIFINRISVDAQGNASSVLGPVSTNDLESFQKSKPSLLQAGDRATVFFTTTGSGQSNLYFAHFNGATFGSSVKLDLGYGFESVGSVSVVGRTYQGENRPSEGLNAGDPMIEMAIAGKLRGRPNRELFLGRLRSSGNGQPLNVPGTRQPFLGWGRLIEPLILNGDSQSFSTRGVLWFTSENAATTAIDLLRTNPTTFADESLIVPGSKRVDAETGIVTANLHSGGQVYFDSNQGTVRFTGFRPNVAQNIRVQYTPRLMRISTVSTASYTSPSIVWDNRYIGEFDYYAIPGGGNPVGATIPADRFTVTVGRTAVGAGQTSRPYLSTLRFGHQLAVNGRAVSLHTQPNGNVTNIAFSTPPTGPYQVDPASGRVYYTGADEGRNIVISSFTYVDEATGAPIVVNVPQTATGTLLVERAESPVLIENAINESQLWSFIDPFDNAQATDRRPGLIWMIWTSTRGGAPDVYMQSIAPKYAPRPVGRSGS